MCKDCEFTFSLKFIIYILNNNILYLTAVPDSFGICTIILLPKGHDTNMSDSANFRGIALISVFGKVFDNIFLEPYHQKLSSCDMQFGSKPKISTNMCSMVLKEVLSYYVQHQSLVFCTFLDATKAFDRIKYCKLLKLLLQCHLPARIIRVLVNFYSNNLVRVSWCGAVSDYFVADNGVKQGTVLRPVLFVCI